MKPKATVLVADRHELMRRGVIAALQAAKQRVVADTNNGRDAVKLVRKHSPTIALLDVHLPRLNGIEAAREIKQAFPKTKVIFLTDAVEDHFIQGAVRMDAKGYILKSESMDVLPKAIETVQAGGLYYSAYVRRRILKQSESPNAEDPTGLTPREIQVIQLIAEGYSTKEIGIELEITSKTVDHHRQNIINKLGMKDVGSLTKFALRAGITKL